MLTNIPRGTKDILPDQVYQWQQVENTFFELCRRYGFHEIRTPMFEHTELFARGVGDTTDIVEKQMYTFDDNGGRSLTLKPEGTASLVRAFVEHKLYAESLPLKLCYNISCFRYEKPQAGRLREFHQLGAEVLGAANMMADAEVIGLASDFLTELGVRDLELHINSIGCPQCRDVYRKALQEFLRPQYDQLCDTCKGRFDRNPMRILDCKSSECQELAKGAPRMLDYLCQECEDSFRELKENLDAMGIEYQIDPGIVRGLDYYTKTAFEFVSGQIGAQGTVCGGGRYDHLIREIGGPDTPGVGFALGIERLLLTLAASGRELPKEQGIDVFLAVLGDQARMLGQSLIHRLRRQGVLAEMDVMGRTVKNQFKYANRLGARYTVVIGDDEIQKGVVSLKNMATSEQKEVQLDQLLSEIQKKQTEAGGE